MKVTADDIAQLLASPRPREVPAHVTKAAQRQGSALTGAGVGFVFALVGLFFCTLIFPRHLWDEWRLARAGAATTQGTVTAVTQTNVKVNKQPVMGTTFTFTPTDGKPRTAECYTTGTAWGVGETVRVRYWPGETDLACIEGGRLDEVAAGGALVAIFPLIGISLMVSFVRQRRETLRLLVTGQTAEVDVLSVDRTSTRVNGRYVHRINLSSPAGGAPVTFRRSNPVEIELMRRHAGLKQPVFILYNPQRLGRVIFPESLIDP